jgi:hypothetical protein
MLLPLLPLQTGVVLQGVSRRGGRATADEDASGRRRRTTAPAAAAFGSSGATRLSTVAIELRTPTASAISLARRWQASVRASMLYKRQIYTQERAAMQAEIYDAQAKVAAFVRQARGGGADALADAQTPTWDVSEKVSSRWQSLVMQSASLDRLVQTAQSRHDLVNNTADFGTLRVEFASAIEDLVADYPSQPVLLETIADVVEAFIRQPLIASTSLINFVLLGNPGAGKTRLATTLAAVLGKLGLFVYDQLVVCGRSDFVAEYEGQTAVKSRNFLMGNLEKIIFLDEAYSLTTWDHSVGEPDRKLSAYSSEAVTEMVAFLSQRVGATCLIAAGYEEEMLNDFVPSNPGLERRLTNRVWLKDYSIDQLIGIYLTALASALSDPPPAPKLTRVTTQTYFTTHALNFLSDIIEGARVHGDTGAASPLLDRVFAAQAGAMATLANVTAMLIASSKRGGRVGLSDAGLDTWALGYLDVYDVLSTLLMQQLGPASAEAVGEVEAIAAANGWLVSGVWQVSSGSGAPSVGRRRVRM